MIKPISISWCWLKTLGRHHYIRRREMGRIYQSCVCGAETKGWNIGREAGLVYGSQSYWNAVHDELMDLELSVHGGG